MRGHVATVIAGTFIVGNGAQVTVGIPKRDYFVTNWALNKNAFLLASSFSVPTGRSISTETNFALATTILAAETMPMDSIQAEYAYLSSQPLDETVTLTASRKKLADGPHQAPSDELAGQGWES